MERRLAQHGSALLLAVILAACGGPAPEETPADAAEDSAQRQPPTAVDRGPPAPRIDLPQPTGEPLVTALAPLPGKEAAAPTITDVKYVQLRTTAGDVTIAVYPQAAPNSAARFLELVESGFYDNTPVSRVVPGFVAQFGINWRRGHRIWMDRPFIEDPTLFALERGTLAFAKTSAPNSASTQIFINYENNNRLADSNFTTFAVVVDGMAVVDGFARVGDPSGGLDQARLRENGDAYLASLSEQPTMIETATVL